MKRILFLLSMYCCTFSLQLSAADHSVELRPVNITDSSLALNSRMKDGKVILALSVTEVRVNTKRCLANPVNITFNVSPQEYKEILWCKWDPLKQQWELLDKPKPVKDAGGHLVLNEAVSCPGYYGYFTRPQGIPKGVKIKVPARYRIDRLRLDQEYPVAFTIEVKPSEPTRECSLTVGDIRFDTVLHLRVKDKSGVVKELPPMLAGRFLDFLEEPDQDGYRVLEIPANVFEEHTEPLTIKTN